MPKKKWTKPELIILLKGRPEEAILAGCKGGDTAGPQSDYELCDSAITECSGQCDAITST